MYWRSCVTSSSVRSLILVSGLRLSAIATWPAFELHPEHRARERLGDLAFHLDLLVLLGHRLSCRRTKIRRDAPPRTDYGTKPAFSLDLAAVRILGGPSSTMATVCSKWAAR